MPASELYAQGQAPAAQLELEDLTIDRAGEIPIGVQLAWGLRARIGDGRLAPGQRLPGLRELAEMLGINANTARSVYQRLEQEGLIDSRQGTGTFVASVAQEPSAVGQIAADAARQARQTGVDPREVAAALYVTAEPASNAATYPDGHRQAGALGGTPHRGGQASKQAGERRRELRAQIAALEQTLSEIQSSHPGLVPAPSKPFRQAGPRLLNVQELERVRTELVRRIAATEPPLKAPADKRKTAVSEQRSASDAEEQASPPKPVQERRAPRARPRTRPSTA
ncbi:MAG TPA: GntR family transcriptional regulator [Solirubrobacteraceae bacterium]|jgi:DNA-binding transcriptional regulator YhcF (GntR family)|nr:GntR family transcriptional regulator [Solirubrobacteraceae bacterium]